MERDLEKLAAIRIAKKELKQEEDALMESINKKIIENELQDGTVFEMPEGKFTLSFRKNWEYSENVKNLKQAHKDAEKEEQQKGIATYTEKPSLTFKKYE